LVTIASIVLFIVAGCYTGPGVAHYAAILDEVHPPASWHVLQTRVHGPSDDAAVKCSPITDGGCPSVARVLLVDGDAKTALADAEDAVRSAGFTMGAELGPACDGAPGSPLCSFQASRGDDKVFGYIWRNPTEAGIAGPSADQLTAVIAASR
jgi:hypothetical protein